MTITPYEGQTAALADYQDAAVARLATWAESARAAHQVAQSLVKTSFVPVAFRDKPEEATAAILAGMEVGLSPMNALKAFDVIQGQAAPRAITLRAIVQSQGHEVLIQESTASRCIVAARRKGSEKWQRSTWTIDRARDLALLGKDQWKKQPTAMLVARATAEACRLVAADAILGIGYSAEEVQDGAALDAPPVVDETPADQPATRRMSRKKAEPEPEPKDIGDAPEVEDSDHDKRVRQMFALFHETGHEDRDDQIAYVETIIKRTPEHRDDLTDEELAQVIAELQVERGAA